MKTDARKATFEHIEIFGKPALFTNCRIDRTTVPEGWHCYDIRGSDYDPDSPSTLENKVLVNHAGTVLCPQAIPFLNGQDYRPVRGQIHFVGDELTLEEFCEANLPQTGGRRFTNGCGCDFDNSRGND